MSGPHNDGGPAFPGFAFTEGYGPWRKPGGMMSEQPAEYHAPGMSLRAYAAVHVMQGFAAEPNTDGDPALIADVAVRWADALIARLAS